MKEFIKTGSEIKEVEVAEDGGGATVKIDGERFDLSGLSRSGSEVSFAINGRQYRFLAVRDKKTIRIWRKGSVFTFEQTEGKTAASGGAADSASSLSSQMPGTVLKLLRKPGDEVAAGTPLLILEAMKMEHEVAAPADGVVKSYPFAEGQRVMPGDLLVEFEALISPA